MLDVSVGRFAPSPLGCLYILHGKALHCGDQGTEAMFFGPRAVRIEERAPCNRMQEAPATVALQASLAISPIWGPAMGPSERLGSRKVRFNDGNPDPSSAE